MRLALFPLLLPLFWREMQVGDEWCLVVCVLVVVPVVGSRWCSQVGWERR